jgi:queuine tRNA-ribosyltransferase
MLNKIKKIKTSHGGIMAPIFLPDATRGYVKLLNNEELKKSGVGAMVVNTYHLYLQPGMKLIKKAGGIHKFMNWPGPLISDSGGFQVFSLVHKNKNMGKIYDDRVEFKSPLDGSKHILTPEKSIQIQFDLGTDIMVCLDDCPPPNASRETNEKAVERTVDWAKRCRIEFDRQIKKRKLNINIRPKLIAVVQGGNYLDLRKKCLDEFLRIGFDGVGFGGGPVKFDDSLFKVSDLIMDNTPKEYIKFALGLGMPEDIVNFAVRGWNLFDCVIPTREGRHGRLFLVKKQSKITNYKLQITSKSQNLIPGTRDKIQKFYNTINISNSKFKTDFSAINSDSKIPELRNYTKAYLHHLFKMNEQLGPKLASLNNLEFYNNLINKLKK